jgi:nucleoside-diphosphate-sugar epimerase
VLTLKVVVTGGSGRIGRYVIRELLGKHEVTDFDMKKPEKGIEFVVGDITRLEDCMKAFKGADVVVHLAAIPDPLKDPPERVFRMNVMGTFCVLEAAANCGVKKVVATSSDSALGFIFSKRPLVPEYFPMDENHPLRPQDPYGLSKLIDEEICRSYSAAYGIETICLRPCWVWFPENAGYYLDFVEKPDDFVKNLWLYVDARDVAQAFRLALEKESLLHDVFFVTAEDNTSRIDTLKLIEKYYPQVPKISERLKGRSSLIDCSKARRILGYKPLHSWKEFEGKK